MQKILFSMIYHATECCKMIGSHENFKISIDLLHQITNNILYNYKTFITANYFKQNVIANIFTKIKGICEKWVLQIGWSTK